MSLRYRTHQFLRTVWDKPSAADLQLALHHLPQSLETLFKHMDPADQAHSIRVCRSLLRQGHCDPDLLTAALLHDVGKSLVRPTVWERVLYVLANRIAPRQVLKWGKAEANGWKRAFVIARQHPHWGADLVRKHGASPAVVRLIRHHQDTDTALHDDQLALHLSLLQAADSGN
jgi:putative nucleotidyltransferase with HDIG domain